ncbi:MAG: hypothetical protein H7Z72_00700, partial [Bacteroidetes bacterium]|nr:hypothetical protein [Fibrella sp.]
MLYANASKPNRFHEKYLIVPFVVLLTSTYPTAAGLPCGRQQSKGFANITPGTGPESAFDYCVLYGAIALVVLTLGLFVRFMIRPEIEAPRRLKH